MFARVATAFAVIVIFVGLGTAILIARAGGPTNLALAILESTVGQPVSDSVAPVHFVVEKGDTAATVGEKLQKAGLIRSALAFRLVVRLQGLGAELVAGTYELRSDLPLSKVVATLAQGHLSGGFLTIPEGWRALEIADALDKSGITPREDFLREVQQPTDSAAFLSQIPPGHSVEGFLFPDSYRFEPSTPAAEVVHRMLAAFQQNLTPDLADGFQAAGLDLNGAVTLASIVEREAVAPDERPIIASVYLNRLRRGMRLQADPTVQYALVAGGSSATAGPYWKHSLSFADLKTASPYNTYQVAGLPPGPICSPGLASLQAVAHPAVTDYLYFVARPNGTHAFAKTLQEQEENVAKYQN